jgi:hypothetical protein
MSLVLLRYALRMFAGGTEKDGAPPGKAAKGAGKAGQLVEEEDQALGKGPLATGQLLQDMRGHWTVGISPTHACS